MMIIIILSSSLAILAAVLIWVLCRKRSSNTYSDSFADITYWIFENSNISISQYRDMNDSLILVAIDAEGNVV